MNMCPDCKRPYDEHDGECDAYKRRIDDEQKAAEIVNALSRYVNQGRPTNLIVNLMAREHRTLQQSMTTVFLSWLSYLSGLTDNHYDARNEASVKISKAILPVLLKENVLILRGVTSDVHLPHI